MSLVEAEHVARLEISKRGIFRVPGDLSFQSFCITYTTCARDGPLSYPFENAC